jgi:hypothetical protein
VKTQPIPPVARPDPHLPLDPLLARQRAAYPAVIHQQVQHARKAVEFHRRQLRRLPVQRPRNLASGRIAVRVQHPAPAVRAFAGEQ